MHTIRTNIRKGLLTLVVTIVSIAPLASLASVSADSDTGCTPPAQSSYGPGNRIPTGSDAGMFIYQCPDPDNTSKQYVGDWLSAHYVYDPTTQKTTPLSAVIYTYNANTGKYDYSTWDYISSQGGYSLNNHSTANPPAQSAYVTVVGGPAPVTSPGGSGSDPTSDSNGDTPTAQSAAAVGNTGSGSDNTVNNSTNNGSSVNNTSGTTVTNIIGSTAVSGSAAVLSNTVGGSATSGNAITQADVINMLQSSSNALGSGSNVATFTYNIDGNVNGDLLFDPSQIQNVQGNTNVDNTLNNNLLINNTSNATINNDLDLNAASGDATVDSNTQAGDATTGNATSIANIVNSISSAIVAGKSFIGTININGNLNGNILLPANFVDQMLADNIPTTTVTAPNSTNTTTNTTTNTSTVTNTNNQGINNTVTSNAQSGNATESSNTKGGNATSGSATTHVTAFNLTGSNVVASNDILVFVNVVGHWTGLIMNAPAGATAAELGGNVTQNNTVTNTATLNNTNNQQINNNVNVGATTGNAKVKNNTQAGNATSGNAQTAVNLANVENSTLDLSNWFGILFINVFGTWNGSVGVDSGVSNAVASGDPSTMLVGSTSRLVRYTAAPASNPTSSASSSSGASSNGNDISSGTVLAASTTKTPTHKTVPQIQSTPGHGGLLLPAIGVVVSLSILGSERLFKRHQHA